MVKIPLRKHRLPRSFYDRPTETVARELLGKALLRRVDGIWLGGWIVETEAYLSEGDLASHSAKGKTKSNAVMFGRPGSLYVYPIHAKHCLNAVTEQEDKGAAVLIRAIEPVWGIEQMRQNRGQDELHRLTRGPAMLCQALLVDRACDGSCLVTSDDIHIRGRGDCQSIDVTVTGRIGISRSEDLPLRFFLNQNPYVSGRRSDHRS